jgi:hypothetical protein
MSRRSGHRFADKDMRQCLNLDITRLRGAPDRHASDTHVLDFHTPTERKISHAVLDRSTLRYPSEDCIRDREGYRRWHATICPGMTSRSAGDSTRQRSTA